MIRKIILAGSLLIASLAFSQEVDVKKDKITVDKTPVAKIEKDKGIYKIYDLSGQYLFSIDNVIKTTAGNPGETSWLRLTGANGNVREIMPTNTSFTFSGEKVVTRNLVVGEAAFLSTSGINKAMVDEFFSKNDPAISQKVDEAYAKIKENNENEDKIAKDAGISISANGDIKKGGEKIGFIVKKVSGNPTSGDFNISYGVFDAKKAGVAKMSARPITGLGEVLKGHLIETFDNKQYYIHEKATGGSLVADAMADRIVKALYANGYTLGDMSAQFQQEQENRNKQSQEAYRQAENQSLNLLESQGYIMSPKGEKIEGLVSIPYEDIDAKLHPNSGISNITNFGGYVNVKNAAGKVKSYKAKDGYKVFAGSRTFIGAKGIYDDGLNSGSGSELSILGESQFFESDYENPAGYIVHHPKSPGQYYILPKNKQEAYYLGNRAFLRERAPEKIAELMQKSLNCTALSAANYDTTTKEGMIKLLDDYAAKCK